MELSLKESSDGSIQINVVGEFNFSDNSKFREMIRQVEIKRPTHIYLDFSRTVYIDSAALGMLLLLREKADQVPTKIEIKGAYGPVLKVLKLSRFQDLFIIANEADSEQPAA